VKERHSPRICEKRMLKKIFGTYREEVTQGWRKVHNEELHDCIPYEILG
jgi:hypothetical protein